MRLLSLDRQIVVVCLAIIICAAGGDAQTAKSPIVVGPNVQVSAANGSRDHYEVYVGADPENPKDLVGCSMIEAKLPTTRITDSIVYSSFDGGASWTPTLESDDALQGVGDPACVFGPGGKAYFVALAMETDGPLSTQYTSHMLVYRSANEGKTWSEPVKLPMVDRDFISVDTTHSKYRGNVYITANGFARAIGQAPPTAGFTYFRSEDSGKTFSDPYLLAAPPGHGTIGQTQSAILSDGTIVAFFSELLDEAHLPIRPKTPTFNLDVVRSTDGGQSFTRATVAAQAYIGYSAVGSLIPTLAVDNSTGPFKNRLYAVWSDYRFGRSEVLMIHSSDEGKTWSKPIVVNDDASRGPGKGPDDFMPAVAVNRDGVVGVMWYDRRDNPDDIGYWVRFSASLDGGETFLPSVRVSTAPQTYAPDTWRMMWPMVQGGGDPIPDTPKGDLTGAFAVNTWPGHTAGMAATADGVFHPFWVDNRSGIQQVWTAAVNVSGDAVPNGSPELANWKDVTAKVYLEFGQPVFDASRGTLAVDAYLVNTSKSAIRGPLDLRFLTINSTFDTAQAANADNGLSGPGALFHFGAELPGGALQPGQRSLAKHLVFRVTGLHKLSGATVDTDRPVLFNYDARVLAPPAK